MKKDEKRCKIIIAYGRYCIPIICNEQLKKHLNYPHGKKGRGISSYECPKHGLDKMNQ